MSTIAKTLAALGGLYFVSVSVAPPLEAQGQHVQLLGPPPPPKRSVNAIQGPVAVDSGYGLSSASSTFLRGSAPSRETVLSRPARDCGRCCCWKRGVSFEEGDGYPRAEAELRLETQIWATEPHMNSLHIWELPPEAYGIDPADKVLYPHLLRSFTNVDDELRPMAVLVWSTQKSCIISGRATQGARN